MTTNLTWIIASVERGSILAGLVAQTIERTGGGFDGAIFVKLG